jgi:hypothetical protein
MTKEQYSAAIKEIDGKISDLKKQRVDLENQYFEENKEFLAGDKVKLIYNDGKEKIAYVSQVYVGSAGGFSYSFIKAKKDGSPSHFKLWTWGSDDYAIELLEKVKQDVEETPTP